MDSYFLGPLFFLYSPGDHSPDPFDLADDGLRDNNLVADSPDDFEACYLLIGFVALPKIEPSCHSL